MTSAERRVLADLRTADVTPCYVYFLPQIKAQLARIHAAFDDRLEVSYAIKSNPNVALLTAMREFVTHLDASSLGEVERAITAGYPAAAVTFSGPGKRDFEMTRALELGIGAFVCESVDEIARLDEFAVTARQRAKVILRINPLKVPQKFGAHMSGRGSQFGIDEELIDSVVASHLAWRALDLEGFHIFAGSNCLAADAIAENVENCLQVFTRLAEVHNVQPATIIIGSGFGIPYTDEQTPLDVERVAALVNPMLDAARRHSGLSGARVLLEMGRFLVGPAGYLVTSVIRVKESRGTRIAICDAGFNNHLAAFGLMGTVMRRNWPISKIAGADNVVVEHTVVGPLCTTIDLLASKLRLAALEAGDLLAVGSSGAYGLSASPIRFISHPQPREFMVGAERGNEMMQEITATSDACAAWRR